MSAINWERQTGSNRGVCAHGACNKDTIGSIIVNVRRRDTKAQVASSSVSLCREHLEAAYGSIVGMFDDLPKAKA